MEAEAPGPDDEAAGDIRSLFKSFCPQGLVFLRFVGMSDLNSCPSQPLHCSIRASEKQPRLEQCISSLPSGSGCDIMQQCQMLLRLGRVPARIALQLHGCGEF